MIFGIDGCKTGWVAVSIDQGVFEAHHFKHIENLRKHPFELAAVDIPIGLPAKGNRVCDMQARDLLGADRSKVFPGARRSLLALYSKHGKRGRAKAQEELKQDDAKGISCQLWGIVPKISDVNEFALSLSDFTLIRECHPEVVFYRLNNSNSVSSKKNTLEGRDIRRALLIDSGIEPSLLDYWLKVWRIGKGISQDDLLDACACAIAARDVHLGNCIPKDALKDDCDLLMQIWY